MTSRSIESFGVKRSVNVSEFRKSPPRYFINTPVEVLSRGQPIGYLLDAALFEEMMKTLSRFEDPEVLKKEFGLTDGWLRGLTHESS